MTDSLEPGSDHGQFGLRLGLQHGRREGCGAGGTKSCHLFGVEHREQFAVGLCVQQQEVAVAQPLDHGHDLHAHQVLKRAWHDAQEATRDIDVQSRRHHCGAPRVGLGSILGCGHHDVMRRQLEGCR